MLLFLLFIISPIILTIVYIYYFGIGIISFCILLLSIVIPIIIFRNMLEVPHRSNRYEKNFPKDFNLRLDGENLKNRYIDYLRTKGYYINLIDNCYVPYNKDFIDNDILSNFSSNSDIVYKIYKSDVYYERDRLQKQLREVDIYNTSYEDKLNNKINIENKLKEIENKINKIDSELEKKSWPSGKDIRGGSIILLNNNKEIFGFQYNRQDKKVYFKLVVYDSIYETSGAYLGDKMVEATHYDDSGYAPIYGPGKKHNIIVGIELEYFKNYSDMLSFIIYNNINYSNIKFSSKYERDKFSEIINKLPKKQ